MRFLVFSDVHLNLWKLGDPSVRLANQVSFLRQVKGYAYINNISTCLFAGDLFHTHGNLRTEVLVAAHKVLQEFKDLGIEIVGISGNHDLADKTGRVTPLGMLPITLLDRDRPVYSWGDCGLFYGITYTEDKEDLQRQLDQVPSDSVLLLHQGVSGVEINSKGFTLNEALTPDMLCSKIKIAFSGHYHTHKRITENLVIPGALCQHNFADAGDPRGYLDVTVDKEVSITRIHTQNLFEVFKYQDLNILKDKIDSFISEVTCAQFIKITDIPVSKTNEIKEFLSDNKFLADFQLVFQQDNFKKISVTTETPTVKKFIEAQTDIVERRRNVGNGLIEGKYEVPSTIRI